MYSKPPLVLPKNFKLPDFSRPPPPLPAPPTSGEIYAATLGLTEKNPVSALQELCIRRGMPPPYYTVEVI